MPDVNRFSLGAVKEYASDTGVLLEERPEVIGDHTAIIDFRVQAAVAGTGLQHIPDRDPCCSNLLGPMGVIRCRNVQEPGHYGPEAVARVGVVLLL